MDILHISIPDYHKHKIKNNKNPAFAHYKNDLKQDFYPIYKIYEAIFIAAWLSFFFLY